MTTSKHPPRAPLRAVRTCHAPAIHGIGVLALAGICAPVSAASATAGTPSFAGELLAILVPLALIIIALLVVLKLARRRFRLTGDGAVLSVLQILPVGPRERVVLVQTRGGRVFSIGVGAQTVTYITEMTPEDLAQREDDGTVTPAGDIHTSDGR